jgi:hypothetical protein
MVITVAETGSLKNFKTFFLVAALYDLVLGAAFFLLYGPIFAFLDIALPYSTSYIHLTAGFVFVQGVGYWFVYQNMLRNVDIVKLGVTYKAIYALVAFYYLLAGQLPDAIFAWFGVFDVLFLIGFVRFLVVAGSTTVESAPAA